MNQHEGGSGGQEVHSYKFGELSSWEQEIECLPNNVVRLFLLLGDKSLGLVQRLTVRVDDETSRE